MRENYEFPNVDKSDLIYEDEDLTLEITENSYWEGIAEQMIEKGLEKTVLKKPTLTKKHKKKRKRSVPDIRYKSFYEEARKLNFSLDMGKDTEPKIELIMKYFPGRFGDKGRNPVCNMGMLSVGNLFNNLFDYSKERINQ